MHKDEKWQLFANNGEPISGKYRLAELNNPKPDEDEIVGGAVVYLYRKNSDTGVVELLWQQRAFEIDNYPGKWDVSAGGHVNLGETFVEAAVRETHEEIGVEVSEDDLTLVAFRRNKNIINMVYLADWTGKPEDFEFDDGEVAAVKWVPLDETFEFKKKFAKAPVAEDDGSFVSIEKWLKKYA